jgi:hypothetical protein
MELFIVSEALECLKLASALALIVVFVAHRVRARPWCGENGLQIFGSRRFLRPTDLLHIPTGAYSHQITYDRRLL